MMEEGSPEERPEAEDDAAQGRIADLRLRLHASQEQERAARTEARHLSRELGVTRRLLAFSHGIEASVPALRRANAPGGIPRVSAVLLTAGALFTLDACADNGTHVVVSGWAFRPVPRWNGQAATVAILFRHGREIYAAAAGPVVRDDVAAHFASQPDDAAGGARGLADVGFACEVSKESLPHGVELEVSLHLECDGLICEQPTGRSLRL